MLDRLLSPVRLDVQAFLDYLQSEWGNSINTIWAYGRDLAKFAAWVEAGGLVDYLNPTADELGAFSAHLSAEGLAPQSVGRHIAALKSFFRFLILDDRTESDAADLIDLPSCWERLPKALTLKQADRLLSMPCPADRYFLRDRALLEFFYASGARASEVIGLTLAALDLDAGQCRLTGKGDKERVVLLVPSAVAAIRAYLNGGRAMMGRLTPHGTNPNDACGRKRPWLFLSRGGHRLTREGVWHIIRNYGRRARLDEELCHPHCLRHSFGTHLLSGGADIRVIQTLLGHSNIRTTQRYTHVDARRMKSVHKTHHPRA